MRLRERPRHYRCCHFQQKLREVTCAVPGPRRCPHPPHRRHPGQRGLMACQPFPRQRTWLQRASRQLQGQGGRERKTLWCLLSMCVRIVRAMKCGAGPTQPAYHHHSITALHQRTQARDCHSCCAQCNHVTLSVRPPCSLQLWETDP